MIRQLKLAVSVLDPSSYPQLFLIFLFMFLSMILETASISAVFPLIQIITNPEWVQKLPPSLSFLSETNFSGGRAVTLVCLSFFGLMVIKNAMSYVLARQQAVYINTQSAITSRKLFDLYLGAPFVHLAGRNSADLITNIDYSVHQIYTRTVMGFLQIMTEFVVIVGIVSVLIYADPAVALISGGTFCAFAFGTSFLLERRVLHLSREDVTARNMRLQDIQQAMSAVKDIRIYSTARHFVDRFNVRRLAHASIMAWITVLAQLPRLLIEVAVGAIVVGLVIVLQHRNPADLLSILGLYAAAALRLMPSFSRLIGAEQNIKLAAAPLKRVCDDFSLLRQLRAFGAKASPITGLRTALALEDVSFRYAADQPLVVDHVSLQIRRGASVALVGTSGSGKSTLMDLMLGLLTPIEGRMRVDGRDLEGPPDWGRMAGYVPQEIPIFDDTLRRNIAFGIPDAEISDDRVRHVLKLAQLDVLVEGLPEGLDTRLGERGTRVSGGERQRVGIARALYHEPAVIFFDEATSALDNETERAITEAVRTLKGDKTLIFIAHRLSTVRHCETLFFMETGRIIARGPYDELIEECPRFRQMAGTFVESRSEEIDGNDAEAAVSSPAPHA